MKILSFDSFTGGISEGTKKGYFGSFNDGLGLDFRTDPDKLNVMPKLKLDKTPTMLITDMVTQSGNIWMCGYESFIGTGITYRKVGSTYTSIDKGGRGIRYFKESMWLADQNSLIKITNPSTADLSAYSDIYDDYLESVNEALYFRGSATYYSGEPTYTLKTSISETATDKCSILFASTRISNSPKVYIRAISFYIAAKGTGDWTLTLHDASNNSLGSVTVANASLTNSEVYRFNFPAVDEATVDHFHITSSVADGTVAVTTVSDLSKLCGAALRVMPQKDWDQKKMWVDTTTFLKQTAVDTISNITELAASKLNFVPTKSTVGRVGIPLSIIYLAGGNVVVTCTLHDENNNTIGSNTITSSNSAPLPAWTFVNFSLNATVTPGASYHFHFSFTGSASVYIGTETASDTTTAYFYETSQVLETNDYHPMRVFTNKLCIGNNQHLATLDDSEIYDAETLTFPQGESVRCLEPINDLLAIATWQGGDLSYTGKSRIYFWDGTATTYNSFVDIDGQVNAMKANKNLLYVIHGNQNTISIYTGSITLLRRIKYIGQIKSVYTNPGAIDVWENLTIWGLTGGNSTIDHAIYTLGKKNKDYALALNKDFRISTGSVSTNVSIGAILAVNHNTLYVSWKNYTTSGVSASGAMDTNLKSTTSIFTSSMVGSTVRIEDNGTSSIVTATITAFVSSTEVTLNISADGTSGSTFYVGYAVGIDILDTANYETEAYVQLRRFDGDRPNTYKVSKAVSIRTDPLEIGESVELWYRLDNNGDFEYLGELNGKAQPGTYYKSFAFDKRWFEVEFKMYLKTTTTTAPTLNSIEMYYDEKYEYQLDIQQY